MQLTTNQDIEAPIDHVFACVTDFESFARQVMRRGAEVRRMDTLEVNGVGMTWDAAFNFRGKRRQMTIVLDSYQPPSRLRALSEMPGMSGALEIELIALSRYRTRVNVDLDLSPKSLSARLLVQSLKLARGAMTTRVSKRLKEFARQTEESYRRSV